MNIMCWSWLKITPPMRIIVTLFVSCQSRLHRANVQPHADMQFEKCRNITCGADYTNASTHNTGTQTPHKFNPSAASNDIISHCLATHWINIHTHTQTLNCVCVHYVPKNTFGLQWNVWYNKNVLGEQTHTHTHWASWTHTLLWQTNTTKTYTDRVLVSPNMSTTYEWF